MLPILKTSLLRVDVILLHKVDLVCQSLVLQNEDRLHREKNSELQEEESARTGKYRESIEHKDCHGDNQET